MALVAKLVGIQGPAGFIPAETIVGYATTVPALRDQVIAALVASGHLEKIGLKPPPWHVRLWRRLFSRPPALPQGT